ncbi:MAG: HdeD family acid-resistance protein [Vulcanimicrobiaceae bacterium]
MRGILAVLFGLLCFFWTGATLIALVFWIGIFFVLDGAFMIVGAVRSISSSNASHWWWQLLGGIAGIIAGVLTFMYPGITAYTLTILIGAWAIVTGVFELMTAIRLRAALPNEWLWIINGVLSILLGLYFFVFPLAGAISIVWILGFYAILAGVAMIALSFRLRKAA